MEDLVCPVCQDLFKDPVVLSCSHSFCKECLQAWWKGKSIQDCPVCKRRSSRSNPPCNLALKNLCKTLQLEQDQTARAGHQAVCSLHSEKLKLFCLDHQQPVCLICRDSKAHSHHKFRPINEVAEHHRQELQKHREPLQETLKLFQQVQEHFSHTAEYIKLQARCTEEHIQEHFRRFHQFLEEEEEARITALRKEEGLKTQRMKELTRTLSRDIAALSDAIKASEEEIGAEDVSFMLNYKATVKRVQQCPLLEEPKLVSGALIDVAKHLGNLSFHIWNKMKELVSYTPVILDPNTANPEFTLSDDLSTMTHGEKQRLPQNPERINSHRSVWGWEGFTSGLHTWEVNVGDNRAWFVGVAETVHKKKGQQTRFWQIEFYNDRYTARLLGNQPVVLRVKKKLKRIRVYLDWSGGKLSFTDPDANIHIHTFTHTFTNKVFPCIGTLGELPLRISQGSICVTRENLSWVS